MKKILLISIMMLLCMISYKPAMAVLPQGSPATVVWGTPQEYFKDITFRYSKNGIDVYKYTADTFLYFENRRLVGRSLLRVIKSEEAYLLIKKDFINKYGAGDTQKLGSAEIILWRDLNVTQQLMKAHLKGKIIVTAFVFTNDADRKFFDLKNKGDRIL